MKSVIVGAAISMFFAAVPWVERARAQDTVAVACVTRSMPITDVGDPAAGIVRTLELTGAAPVAPRLVSRPSGGRLGLVCHDAWIGRTNAMDEAWGLEVAPIRLRGGWSGGYAATRNDGGLWNGRGVSGIARGGLVARAGILSVGVLPELVYEQNADFPTRVVPDSARSEWAHAWRASSIDMPQRFGDDAFTRITPGQSYIRLDWKGAAAGLSNENLWWGPGIRNGLVLTNNAPGFAHLFAGTREPVRIGPVRVAGEIVWGQLVESDYFDDDPSNDERLFSGAVLVLSSPHVSGLEVGVARVFVRYWPDEWGVRDAFPFLEPSLKNDLDADSTGSRRDDANQLGSVFLRWVMPSAGFEVYGEYAREDHAWDLDDLIVEPDHTAGATLGIQKVFGGAAAPNRLTIEVTRLLLSPTFLRRPAGPFYAHGTVVQGYTHRGQILGASIGPGSESQFAGFDMLRPDQATGVWIERVRRDDLWMYRNMPARFSYAAHDVELTAGLRHARMLGPIEVEGSASYSSRRNRDFRFCNPDVAEARNCQLPQYRDRNVQLWLSAAWRPGGAAPP